MPNYWYNEGSTAYSTGRGLPKASLPYGSPLIGKHHPRVALFELDNYSARQMIGYAQEMIRRSTLILVVVESWSDEANTGNLIRLFNQLSREKPANLQMLLLGRHPLVEKMERPLGDQFRPNANMQQLASMTADLFA